MKILSKLWNYLSVIFFAQKRWLYFWFQRVIDGRSASLMVLPISWKS